ncbi:MAG TPA: hypothetical protein ENL06_00515, partial [Candidatus Portnoybacteria bacterium]|nr:hypothetical protein [Candidatus Portnoybacteria bacterium]
MQYNIFQARNKKYIEHLFYSKPRIFLGSGKRQQDVQKIEIKAVSPVWAEKTCLTKYTIFFRNNTTKKIRSTASNQELLKNAWTVMNYLSQSNNSKIKKAINPPLYFSPRLNLLFYEEIPGDTLTNIFEFNAENSAVIKPYLL